MSNYIIKDLKQSIIEAFSEENGVISSSIIVEKATYIKKLANYKGIGRVMKNNLMDIIISTGKMEHRLIKYAISNLNSKGEILNKSRKHAKLKELAVYLDTAAPSITRSMNKLVKLGLIKKNKRILVVNPYTVFPHNADDETLYGLQLWWDSDFKLRVDDFISNIKEYRREFIRINNKPISLKLPDSKKFSIDLTNFDIDIKMN